MWGVNNRMFEKWIVLIFLFVGMLWDIKKKTVPKIYLVVWAIGAITYLILEIAGEKSIKNTVKITNEKNNIHSTSFTP